MDEWTAMMTHMYQIKPLPVFPTYLDHLCPQAHLVPSLPQTLSECTSLLNNSEKCNAKVGI